MSDNLYSLLRYVPTEGVELATTSAAITPQQIESSMMTMTNINIIVDRIIERADPMRNMTSTETRIAAYTKVEKMLAAWKNLGKFEQPTITVSGKKRPLMVYSLPELVQLYNREFVASFAESIMPAPEITKVKSVVNPDGMYAQQTNTMTFTSKPVPFYERAIFKRLNAWDMEKPIDETEMPFYRLDKNPRLPEAEKKKRDLDTSRLPSYLDREGLSYRMKPNY